MSPVVLAFAATLALITGACFVTGARPALDLSIASALALAATLLIGGQHLPGFRFLLFLIDLLLLVMFLWVAWRRSALWPTASAALQLIAVLGHVAAVTEAHVTRIQWSILVQWTAWPSLAVLGVGLWLDRRAGRISSPWSLPVGPRAR